MTRISPREWENLSAYLDEELPEKERTRLESRLKGNPELKAALEDLRRIRLVLRSQPRLRAHRNFTLTPEMVAKPGVFRNKAVTGRFERAFPALRFASALASILLVLVVLGDLLTGAPPIPRMYSASAPQAVTTEQLMLKEAPVEEAARGSQLAPEAQATSTEAAMSSLAAGAYPAPQATDTGQTLLMAPAQSTASPEPTVVAFAQSPANTQQDTALQPPSVEDAQPVGNLVEGSERLLNHRTLRILEITLFIMALGSGLLAIYLRRAHS